MTRDAMIQLSLDRDPTLRICFGEEVMTEVEAAANDKLTIAECQILLDALRTKRPASHALLQTKKCTGRRFCYVSALQWGDIDWANMLVRFHRKQDRLRYFFNDLLRQAVSTR